MEKNVMVLKDGAEITLESASSLGDIRVLYADKSALIAGWERLNKENLSQLQIESGDGVVLGRYEGLVLGDPVIRAIHERKDGLLAVYNLREKTELEKLDERVGSVEETTDVLTMEALGGGETA